MSLYSVFDVFSRVFLVLQATEVVVRARTTISKDATLYYYDRRKYFRIVGLASCSQSVFWIYLAYFQYTTRPQLIAHREKMNSSERQVFSNIYAVFH